jgi:hypothetical protein
MRDRRSGTSPQAKAWGYMRSPLRGENGRLRILPSRSIRRALPQRRTASAFVAGPGLSCATCASPSPREWFPRAESNLPTRCPWVLLGPVTAASFRQTLGDCGRSLNQDSVPIGIAWAVNRWLCSARKHDLQSPSRFGTIRSLGTWLWVVSRQNRPNKPLNRSRRLGRFTSFKRLGGGPVS